MKKTQNGVFAAIGMAARSHHLLTAGTLLCVAASVAASLLPPLLLGRVIDRLTGGTPLTFLAVLLYFGSLALEGLFSSAQESLLVLFGQKMTHALRSEMSQKLTRLPAGTLAEQNPGEVAARFSGDVDTVEALFTSGIISMVADACRIVSIMAVIAVKNTGLALILLLVLPLFAVFTRHMQKRMLAAQLDNRRAVAAVSGQGPETLHNIRTIRALGIEDYMERRYDRRIGDGYAAMERTNFYDAVYSPVVLLLNAVVVGVVMLLSASGKAEILTLFGMSVGTSVTVINYISRIFAPIENLGMEIQTIQSAMAGVKRIDAFLAQPERTIPQKGESAARGDVVLSHVTFGYGERCVLKDLSLTVKQGEQVTLVGRTGAGKAQCSSCWGSIRPRAVRSPSAAWTFPPFRMESGGPASAVWSSTSPACRERYWIRSPSTTPRSPVKWRKMRQSWRRSTMPSGRCRRAMIPCVRTACSLRVSGSCCPSPGPRRQTPPCCCWTRSPPIWTRRPRRGCWKPCGKPLRGARFSPFPTGSMKIWAAGRWRSNHSRNKPKSNPSGFNGWS